MLDQMRQAVCELAETPVSVRDGDAGERIKALAELRSAVDAQMLAELATFETRGGHQAAGCHSVGGWVRLHLRKAASQAGVTVGIARALGGPPAAAAALSDGSISIEHVAAIVGGVRRIGAVEMGRHEQTLVDLAREASPAEVRAAVAEIVRLVEAEPGDESVARRAERRAAEAEASRCFASRRVGDQVVFNGAVDLATGEALATTSTPTRSRCRPPTGPETRALRPSAGRTRSR